MWNGGQAKTPGWEQFITRASRVCIKHVSSVISPEREPRRLRAQVVEHHLAVRWQLRHLPALDFRKVVVRAQPQRNRRAGQRVELVELLGGERASLLRERVDRRLAQLCLLYTSPSPRDQRGSRMPSSA